MEADLHSNIFKLIQYVRSLLWNTIINLHSNIFKLIQKDWIDFINKKTEIYILIYLN